MKRAGVNYRKLYKEHYGIDFGKEMAVHHIDFDRTNNHISNLLLMPRELHAKYHWYITQLGGDGSGHISADMRISENTYRVYSLRGLADALEEIKEWQIVKYNMDMGMEAKKHGTWIQGHMDS